MNLDEVAHELYGLPPEGFTEARNARAKEITAAGNRELATQVRRLPKPTVAAWLANVLVRTHVAKIAELVALGPELRAVQRRKVREDMRRVADRRRELTRELVAAASESAAEAGLSMGSQVQRQLEETLEAAVADEGSAAALQAGRLSGPLRFIGFGGAPSTESDIRRAPSPRPGAKTKKAAPEASADEAMRHAAERALAEADRSLATAQGALASAKVSVDEARRRHNEASARHRAATKE